MMIRSSKHLSDQQGLTLIELMVTMAVALLMMGFVAQILINSNEAYDAQQELAELQENGRFASEFLARGLRLAGNWGCAGSRDDVLNHLDGVGGTSLDFDQAINGQDGSGFSPSDAGGIGAADEFSVTFGAQQNSCDVEKEMPGNGANLKVTSDCDLEKEDIVFVSDCDVGGDIFQVTSVPSGGGGSHKPLGHNTGNSVSPGNDQVSSAGCSNPQGNTPHCLSKSYDGEAFFAVPQTTRYYIADPDGDGRPGLYRQVKDGLNPGTPSTPEELIAGVENLQVRYGEDTDQDQNANRYVSAGDVSNWGDVIAVRMAVVVRSEEGVAEEPTDYTVFGTTYTPTDQRSRRVFNATVALRNRLN